MNGMIGLIRISIGILLFLLGVCMCLEGIDLGPIHPSVGIAPILSLSPHVQSPSPSTKEMEKLSSSTLSEMVSSFAPTEGATSLISSAEIQPLTEVTALPSSSPSSSSSVSPSLLPSRSSLNPALVTPTVDQLLRIFNNTDTPPDNFLEGIRHLWKRPLKKCYRKRRHGVSLSMYWIPKEGEWDELENGHRILLHNDGVIPLTPLLDPKGQIVANVSRNLWSKCRMEGTCLLKNGDLINLAQGYTDRFVVIGKKDRKENIFGWGAGLQNLRPYVSVAANDVPLGTTLYVRELDGLDLGNGQKHNGCVSVDDDGWSFGGCQLDFFVVSYVDHLWLDRELDVDQVSVTPIKCDLLNYSTMDHLKYMNADAHMDTLTRIMNATMVLPKDTLSLLIA